MQKLTILLICFVGLSVSYLPEVRDFVRESGETIFENKFEVETIPSLLAPTPKQHFDIHSRVGIVDVGDNQLICFRTKNGNLAEKSPISIVTSLYQFPQKVLPAIVEKKLEKSCVSDDADAGEVSSREDFYYSLLLADPKSEKSEIAVGIGVIQITKQIEIQNELASVDINGDGKPEFFRLCASNEGLHLTIWTGKPLKGKRIWHSYYYLHYDTEPDCKKKDWEGTER